MFKRVRELHISLAAKCQLLFGAAVVLIIAAALFVPWQRMEQLTEQINVVSARERAQYAKVDHVIRMNALSSRGGGQMPASMPLTGAEGADAPPRLFLIKPRDAEQTLSRFEEQAVEFFKDQPESKSFYKPGRNRAGQSIFRYAEPLMAEPTCLYCHAHDLAQPLAADVADPSAHSPTVARAATSPLLALLPRPATGPRPATSQAPATAPAEAAADAGSRGQAADGKPATRPAALLGVVSIEIPSRVETRDVILNRIFILVAGLLAGTLAIIVFYLITTRLILQPVRVLQETAEKVSQGDLNIRSDISTGDEFQQLSETFNKMLANLKVSEDQLRAVNKGLDLKLVEMSESNVALYESNRLKSEFLANVSHELRTPLNSILGFAELLRDAAPGADARSSRYVQNILSSGKNLLELINDLLDLAKIEAGRMEVRSEPLSLNDMFEGLVSILKPLSEKKQLRIAASVAVDVPIVRTDPAKLQQILYNFLSNAIKFSPAGGAIQLIARREADDRVRVVVADEGPGIGPEKHAVIFEKFRQVDASVTREHSGTGLGLAISKELTQLLSGAIGVESQPGHGARFWIEIPLKIESGARDVRQSLVLS